MITIFVLKTDKNLFYLFYSKTKFNLKMGDFWKATADMFGSLFEKPKMAEKLLIKPPFKYIFDIISETIKVFIFLETSFLCYTTKVTGFAKGLYNSEEMNSASYSTKEQKVFYLRKIITLTSSILNEEIEAKPNKIVAGVEPEYTNAMLQGNKF